MGPNGLFLGLGRVLKMFWGLFMKLNNFYFCQAQPQLKIKLQLGAEVAILSA